MKVYFVFTKNFGDGMNWFIFKHFIPSNGPHQNHHIAFQVPRVKRHPENEPCLFGAGSILSAIPHDKDHDVICGSGFISDKQPVEAVKEFISVRGPRTRQRFLDAGIDCPAIYGDLGLLMRCLAPHLAVTKKYKVGIIPHCEDYRLPSVADAVERSAGSWTVINILQSDNPYKFLRELQECELILSSSLHGIVVADSYGIPAHHVVLSDKVVGGDFKFRDYYESVGRDYYTVTLDGDLATQCKPYTLKFDIDGYYRYIKQKLAAYA